MMVKWCNIDTVQKEHILYIYVFVCVHQYLYNFVKKIVYNAVAVTDFCFYGDMVRLVIFFVSVKPFCVASCCHCSSCAVKRLRLCYDFSAHPFLLILCFNATLTSFISGFLMFLFSFIFCCFFSFLQLSPNRMAYTGDGIYR